MGAIARAALAEYESGEGRGGEEFNEVEEHQHLSCGRNHDKHGDLFPGGIIGRESSR